METQDNTVNFRTMGNENQATGKSTVWSGPCASHTLAREQTACLTHGALPMPRTPARLPVAHRTRAECSRRELPLWSSKAVNPRALCMLHRKPSHCLS